MQPKEMIPLMLGGSFEVMKMWREICMEGQKKQDEWIAHLRATGFKAAHPDDGWVDRKKNEVTFCYPYFNDGAKAGDLVALGSERGWRSVRLTREIKSMFGGVRYAFTCDPGDIVSNP